jgi:hypothetical protein
MDFTKTNLKTAIAIRDFFKSRYVFDGEKYRFNYELKDFQQDRWHRLAMRISRDSGYERPWYFSFTWFLSPENYEKNLQKLEDTISYVKKHKSMVRRKLKKWKTLANN